MPQNRISTYKAAKLLSEYALNGLSKARIAKDLNISRGTVNKYVDFYESSDLTYTDILLHSDKSLVDLVYPKRIPSEMLEKSERLTVLFPEFHKRFSEGDANLKQLWEEYSKKESSGYKYSQFVFKYHEWCKNNNIKNNAFHKRKIYQIEPKDLELLRAWRLSTDRGKWEKAVALLGLYRGESIVEISKKIGVIRI